MNDLSQAYLAARLAMPVARLVRFTPPDIDLQHGEWSYHDHRAISGELDGASIMKAPIEMVVTTMVEASQLCNITVLNGENGSPFGAVAVIIGAPPVIGAFVSTLQYTSEQLTKGTPLVPTH